MDDKRKLLIGSALVVLGGLSPETIIKAWKDPSFFASLSEEVRAQVPKNPAGEIQTDWRVDKSQLIAEATLSSDCNTLSSVCNTVSSSCSTNSSDCNTASSSCSTVSSSCNTVSSGCSTVSSDCNTDASCNTTSSNCSSEGCSVG